MNRIVNGWRAWRLLSQTQRAQWLQAWVLLPLVSAGLRVLGLRRMQAVLYRPAERITTRTNLSEAVGIAEIFFSSTHWNPVSATCLAQSLVLHWLLHRYGLDADLRIGVNRRDGQFAAHAWVEHDGVALEEQQICHQFLAFDQGKRFSHDGNL